MEEADLTAATIAVLEDWYQAIETGTATYRYPSSSAAGVEARRLYSDEEIDRIIAAIDEEIDQEVRRNQEHWTAHGVHRGCDFKRLGPLQRRALVEDLSRLVARGEGMRRRKDEEMRR